MNAQFMKPQQQLGQNNRKEDNQDHLNYQTLAERTTQMKSYTILSK